jgi:4-carboxymuconolactone decarboxylase
MDKQTYERGLEIRKSVLGKEFVEKSIASADDFNRPLQELVTEWDATA